MNLTSEISKFQQYVELYKYEHIVFGILEAIQKGKMDVGSKLPSVNKMHEATGYSRMTIDKAYKCLVKQGIVKSVRLKGYFVINTEINDEHMVVLNTIAGKLQGNEPHDFQSSIRSES